MKDTNMIIEEKEFLKLCQSKKVFCIPTVMMEYDLEVLLTQDALIELASCKGIDTIFYEYTYPQNSEFIIDANTIDGTNYKPLERIINQLDLNPDFTCSLNSEIYPDEESELSIKEYDKVIGLTSTEKKLKKAILAYNKSVDLSQTEKPRTFRGCIITDGKTIGIDISKDKPDVFPSEMALYEMMVEFQEEAAEKERKKKEEGQRIKQELKERLLNDTAFLICSNKSLRNDYAQELWDGEDKKIIRKYFASEWGNGKWVSNELISFVELVYKEYKFNKGK